MYLNRNHFHTNTPRILLTGVTSIHGWPIYQKLASLFRPDRLCAVGSPKMKPSGRLKFHPICITDRDKLKALSDSFSPTHIIHCGGVCDLDVCEARPEWAHHMNQGGARVMQELFSETCHITYASSDLVFSGINPPKNGYHESHTPDPISVVGNSYLKAEKTIASCKNSCIVRLGLPLGDSFTGDKGPIDWIESRFKRNLPVTLFYDEKRSCIACDALAEKVTGLVLQNETGLFHCGGEKSLSLYDIGHQVLLSGDYPKKLLKQDSRLNDVNGPPRIGDVSLDSSKLNSYGTRSHLKK